MSLLAIDIGGSAIKYGVVSKEGKIISKGNVLNERVNYESFIETLTSVIDKNMNKSIRGIALSIPAIMNPKSGMIISEGSMPFLVGVNLKEILEEKYALKVHSENDGNCGALAEVWLGAAKDNFDVAMVVIGTGVGGAVVKNRKIHPGANFISGEFGYFISDYNFEKKDFKIWSESGAILTLTDRMFEKKGKVLTGVEIFELEEGGDQDAIQVVQSFFQSTAVGLFNLQYFYDPEIIIIGGGVSSRLDFVQRVETELSKIYEVIDHAPIRPTLKTAKFGNDANLIGAVFNFLQEEGQV
jgi:glucokinase